MANSEGFKLLKGIRKGFPGSSVVKNLLANTRDAGDASSTHGSERSMEEEMATHSSILAWKIPWTEDPGRLQSKGSQESDTTEQLSMHTCKGLGRV